MDQKNLRTASRQLRSYCRKFLVTPLVYVLLTIANLRSVYSMRWLQSCWENLWWTVRSWFDDKYDYCLCVAQSNRHSSVTEKRETERWLTDRYPVCHVVTDGVTRGECVSERAKTERERCTRETPATRWRRVSLTSSLVTVLTMQL